MKKQERLFKFTSSPGKIVFNCFMKLTYDNTFMWSIENATAIRVHQGAQGTFAQNKHWIYSALFIKNLYLSTPL